MDGSWGNRDALGAGAVVAGIGAVMAVLHAAHGVSELPEELPVMAYGAILPAVVSLLVLASGYWIVRRDWSATNPWRVVGWFVGSAAIGIVLVGLLVLYQAAEGVVLSDRAFAIAIFATYGGAVGLLVGRYDAERQARQARQRAEARRLEEFASVVSHDLRNPLNVASGRLELAREECDSDHLDDLERALDRMDALIDDLLALARAGEAAADVEPVALADVAESAWGTVETGDARLVVEADRTIRADRGRLRQLLENLFRNAVEHGSTGPPSQAQGDAAEHGSTSPRSQAQGDVTERSSVGSRTAERSDDAVEHGGDGVTVTVGDLDGGFYVADDGPGIPKSERDRIFEAGYSTTTEGTGFGLSIVEEVVDAHGWEIRATESDDGGARFEITGVGRG